MSREVRFPAKLVGTDDDDLREPLEQLLQGAGVLGTAGAAPDILRTPQSVATIEAGATALAKWWSLAVGAGGFAAAATAVGAFWDSLQPRTPLAVTFVGGVALVVAATIFAIASMVRADVRARSDSAAAQYGARARIAEAYLQACIAVQTAPPPNGRAASRPDDVGYVVRITE